MKKPASADAVTLTVAPIDSCDRTGNRRMPRLFCDRRVSTKIVLVVGAVAATAIAVGAAGLTALNSTHRQADAMHEDYLKTIITLNGARHDLLDTYNKVGKLGNAHEVATQPDLPAQIADGLAKTKAEIALAADGEFAPDEVQKYATLSQALHTLQTIINDKLEPMAGDDAAFYVSLHADADPALTTAEDDLRELVEIEYAELDAAVDEINSSYEHSRTIIFVLLAAGLALGTVATWWTLRIIMRPLRRVSAVLAAVAAGDLTQRVEVDTRDEVSKMATSLNRAVESMRVAISTMANTSTSLADSANQQETTRNQIAASAQETSAQAGVAAAAAEQVTRNVQTVSAGSEELGASIREIAQNANDAAQVASEAVEVAEATNRTVSKLGESSVEIGNVIKVITSIAEQTNLLALNATIEAARAGDAGKGFAVVASEVKDLAQETAKATDDISRRVAAIQTDTTNAVAAIGEISRIITRINDYQVTIASAVEEQTATTSEMNRNVNEAAIGSAEIATNIASVANAAQTTTDAGNHSRTASENLVHLSTQMRTLVGRFQI